MTLPLVSICTPTYRRPHYLRELIDSILAQRYPAWELWICDNSDDDQTARLLEGYRDPRVHYAKNERNLGMGGNTLRALSHAAGAYFTFTPDDDRWHPDNLLRKVTFLTEHPDLDVVFSNADRIDARGAPLRRFQSTYFQGGRRLPSTELRPAVDAGGQHFVNILTGLMRRELLPIFRESWHLSTEEYFMWWLGCRPQEIGFLGEPLVTIREAEHHRTVVQGGQVVDYKGKAEIRQQQLMDFYRSLLIFHPEIAPVLESPSVKRFVADAVLGSSNTAWDLLRGAALVSTGLGPDLGVHALQVALGTLQGVPLAPARHDPDPSGIGAVER